MGFNCTDFYDAELKRLDPSFRAAMQVAPGDRVLDVGCGAGQSTRDAALAAHEGSVVGLDISAEMLRVARERAAQAGLRNVEFVLGDAQDTPFPAASFDIGISRFGTMFFADPAAAFANIARALRPEARLVLLVWQEQARNQWSTAIQQALADERVASASAPTAFSLGNRTATRRLLESTGFVDAAFAEVHEPVFYGPTVEAAYEAVVTLFLPRNGTGTTAQPSDKTQRALHALLQAQLRDDGVFFDSRAWIVTARRR
jgi:ubiquinone/menaquinone biosynthesis C-methylase UbiE